MFVNKSMKWKDAKSFCRDHHTDLALVRNSPENERIAALLPADAWIGLFRWSWKKWSDRSRVAFTGWGEGQPGKDGVVASCGAADAKTATWRDDDCNLERPFICYSVQETQKTRVKLKFLSGADPMDPDAHRQILEQVHCLCDVVFWRSLNMADGSRLKHLAHSFASNWPKLCRSFKSAGWRKTGKSFTRKRQREEGGVCSLALCRCTEAFKVELSPQKQPF